MSRHCPTTGKFAACSSQAVPMRRKKYKGTELVSACNGNINSMYRITHIFRDLSKKASVLLLKHGLTKSLSMEDDTTATTKSTACCGGNTEAFRMCKRTFISPTCTKKNKTLCFQSGLDCSRHSSPRPRGSKHIFIVPLLSDTLVTAKHTRHRWSSGSQRN